MNDSNPAACTPAPNPSGRRRLPRPALLTLLGALLAGCALAPELAWQRVDDIIVSRANHWLDLEPVQEQRLRERLSPWLRELRRERLPRYARFLRRAAEDVDTGIEAAELRRADERFEALYRDTVRSFLPVIVPTLADLSETQRRHLARRIAERNEEYRDDYVEGRDQGRFALAERIIRAVERWTGALDAGQRALIHRRVDDLPLTAPGWLEYRQRMQQRLLDQIEAGAPQAELAETLEQWWVRRGQGPNGADIGIEELREGLYRLLAALGGELTPAQLAEARRRLNDRAGYLETLAAGAP